VPTSGDASPAALAPDGLGGLSGEVVGSTDVFWLMYGAPLEINAISQDGGATTTLVAPLAQSVNDMTVAGDGTLYWTTDFQIQALKP
jgi:hypothetical protein